METKIINGVEFNVKAVKLMSKTEFKKVYEKSAKKRNLDCEVWYYALTGKNKSE